MLFSLFLLYIPLIVYGSVKLFTFEQNGSSDSQDNTGNVISFYKLFTILATLHLLAIIITSVVGYILTSLSTPTIVAIILVTIPLIALDIWTLKKAIQCGIPEIFSHFKRLIVILISVGVSIYTVLMQFMICIFLLAGLSNR